MATVIADALQPILRQGRPYPAHLLAGMETGLAIFSAAFHGWNDVIYLADAGIRTTCVDTDLGRLEEMRTMYTNDWEFVAADAWQFADQAVKLGQTWDVVTVDPYRPMISRGIESLPLWCSLARRLLTIGVFSNDPRPPIPDGWDASLFPRTDEVGWLVLTGPSEDA